MRINSKLAAATLLFTSLALSLGTRAQEASANGQTTPGRPGSNRTPSVPVETQYYRSTLVKLGGGARDGLLYEPKVAGPNAHVAVLYSDRNFGFDPPAAELAKLGYQVLYVSYPPLRPGDIASPFDGFIETSQGIIYLRSLPGVRHVVIEGWGAGATSMALYATLAAHGPAACQGKDVLYPCTSPQASGLAKPDGLILLDAGLASATRVNNIDPAFDGRERSRLDLDKFAAANGYDAKTGLASYSADFRKRYFAAQAALNRRNVEQALARLKVLEADKGPGADEPFIVPGSVNVATVASLQYNDLSILSHSKHPHTLLKADGSIANTILRSVRPTRGPVGADAIQAAESRADQPARAGYTLREFLANDAIRTAKRFSLTDDDVTGFDWKSSNLGTPAHAEGITIPSLVMTNTCFEFVVTSEIVYDHLAAQDKTLAGVEGSEHEFTPCKPQYGDTKKRLFAFVGDWLGKPGRF